VRKSSCAIDLQTATLDCSRELGQAWLQVLFLPKIKGIFSETWKDLAGI